MRSWEHAYALGRRFGLATPLLHVDVVACDTLCVGTLWENMLYDILCISNQRATHNGCIATKFDM